ncbi:site-specific integrase [Acetobacter thailandicus]|uniref:site-specific integrase n=1 Tax=Acetobacter thailandicus TaxID=1502842 RepID=UPI001BA7D598|nr:site-specific integrase [Acetobacter thailandicus]MBS0981444.1 site-specific integrase [Acetobacter thailandicus]
MLRVRGTTYHFRRIVPPALRAALNRREIWVSLKTGYQNEARRRASLLHARTTQLFMQAYSALAEPDALNRLEGLRVALRDLQSVSQSFSVSETGFVPVSAPMSKPQRQNEPAKAPKAQPLMLSGALKRFVLDNPHASADTKKATQRAVDLFLQAFGDAPVPIIGGEKAGAFRDLLFSLPASLGKRKSSLTLEEEAQRTREEGLPTLSGKSVKNHMMRLSALWNQLLQRELVTRNPWTGWTFENGQKTVRRSWTTKELALLASASWHGTSVPEQTFRLVTLIAAYSGMRLGEICTLRKEDLQSVDGIPCFLIRPHTETGWAPKTEAGTRMVPVHSKLIEAGVLMLKETTDDPYLIPGLETSKQGVRGAALGRAFSLLKTRIGLPAEITFHSFRHTVSTQLRNAKADIREIWIDHLLGHEATHKSQGTTTYLTGISTANLQQTIEAISYPKTAFKKGTL